MERKKKEFDLFCAGHNNPTIIKLTITYLNVQDTHICGGRLIYVFSVVTNTKRHV